VDPLRVALAHIRLLVLDADGVLTDGAIYWSDRGEAGLAFHVRDGWGIRRLIEAGFLLAVISGRRSEALAGRVQALGISHLHQAVEDKGATLANLQASLECGVMETAALGDDEPDLSLFSRAAVRLAVADAHPSLLQAADYVTRASGGRGAVREVADLLLAARSPA
jgi:3-deoxy-D-manno-octulosonate 8-phosphate phosphatase (KDO 8-P phosphatase)